MKPASARALVLQGIPVSFRCQSAMLDPGCLEMCRASGAGCGADGEGNLEGARTARDATCLGWVAGFAEGFLVHDELLGVPKRDRLACVPNGESAMQIVSVMKRYLANNPEKAHRPTRYIASLALAGAFPCRGGK